MSPVEGWLLALLAGTFTAGLVLGVLATFIWRGASERLARRLLREAEQQRQAETEALLDGVKLAFGDISLDTFGRLAEQLQGRAQGVLAGERRLQAHELKADRAELDARLRTVVEQLERLRGLVHELERDREGKFQKLEAELRRAGEQADGLAATTRRLTDVLASSRRRGQWGERLAEDVLRFAGLEEHVSWRRQAQTADGRRPDFTILIPGGAVLHMDVKFPLENLQRAVDAGEPEPRARAEAAFVRDVRAKVQEIRQRGYVAPEAGTLDVALLFIPSEEVLEAIVRLAPGLLDEALAQGVVTVSPMTLVAVLAVIRRAAGALQLAGAARELGVAVAELAAAFQAFAEEGAVAQRRLEESAAALRAMLAGRGARLERAVAKLAALTDATADGEAAAAMRQGLDQGPAVSAAKAAVARSGISAVSSAASKP